MAKYKQCFQRKEVKYILNEAQLQSLTSVFETHMEADEFFETEINNLYYDTPDFRLIRRSLEKPVYKEKLRLRTYGVPGENDQAFIELKKKIYGVVYKRRVAMPLWRAMDYLDGKDPGDGGQLFQELDWVLNYYGNLQPAMVISYRRESLKGIEDPALRVTFDRDICWRQNHLDLQEGAWGQPVLEPGQCLMELKIPNGMPIWLTDALTQARAYPGSFSKYGKAYRNWKQCGNPQEVVRHYA
ncbi:MAG: polyphosphate polymerase domain-containing protein [Oscillospiraceae bacterium]|nr:polyphosphate polymerase domain-containing protein [Oscillospiraceae bacterium]